MKKLTELQILLASYNGEKYILSQIESIRFQSPLNLTVVIRDDGSNDRTTEKIKELLSNKIGLDIHLYSNELSEKGHCKNFSKLCDLAMKGNSQYFCFSDQDDIWAENKIDILYARMMELEVLHGRNTPILIHSDLCVVDENLNEIASSFIQYQGLPNPKQHDFPEFLYQNVVTGCTCMFNKALLELAAPIPQEAIVHDWWFALCAKYFGVIDFIEKPLVNYRQHSNNAIGASVGIGQYHLLKLDFYKAILRFPKHISISIDQADSLIKLIKKSRESEMKKNFDCINEFSTLKKAGMFQRFSFVNMYMKKNRSKVETLYLYIVFMLIK